MRFGGVAYLNARPLLEGLSSLVLDTPAALSERVARGEVDTALLPVAAGEAMGLPRVGSLGVVAEGKVASVLLFLETPPEKVRRVRLDPASRTSRLLTLLLLRDRFGAPAEETGDFRAADAELVIGDRALQRAARGGERFLDLAEEWGRWTGLPFVFAAWYGDAAAEEALEAAYARGAEKIVEYAEDASRALGLPAADLERYLRHNLRHRIGPREEEGLRHFLASARNSGLL